MLREEPSPARERQPARHGGAHTEAEGRTRVNVGSTSWTHGLERKRWAQESPADQPSSTWLCCATAESAPTALPPRPPDRVPQVPNALSTGTDGQVSDTAWSLRRESVAH